MFSSENAIIVTIDFYNELLKNNIKGIVPIKVLNSVSKSFGKKKSELPVFVHFAFIPSNVENIPIAYDLQDKSPCCRTNPFVWLFYFTSFTAVGSLYIFHIFVFITFGKQK